MVYHGNLTVTEMDPNTKNKTEKTTKGSSLFSRMLTIFVNMLNYTMRNGEPLISIVFPARANKGGPQGQSVTISFNHQLFKSITGIVKERLGNAIKGFGVNQSRAERKAEGQQVNSDSAETTSAATEMLNHPFVAFIKAQLTLIINAPKHIRHGSSVTYRVAPTNL